MSGVNWKFLAPARYNVIDSIRNESHLNLLGAYTNKPKAAKAAAKTR